MKCAVCELNEQKYKCPNCTIPYCSLSCFKIHRPEAGTYNCVKSKKDIPVEPPKKIIVRPVENNNDLELLEEDLQKLAKSESLKTRLDDEHLQKYLIALDRADNADDLFDQLKENQRFQDFCNETLYLIGKKV